MLNARHIALQGVGAAVLSLALQGFVPAGSPPITPPSGGGGSVRLVKPFQFPASVELARVEFAAKPGKASATTGRQAVQALASGRLYAVPGEVDASAYTRIAGRLALTGAVLRASAASLGAELGEPGDVAPERVAMIAMAGAVSAVGEEGWDEDIVAVLMVLMR